MCEMKTTKFKMTELGPIPEDWAVKQLGDLFELSAAGDLQSECSSRVKTNINIHPIYSNGLENAGLYGYTSKPRYRANSITITGRGTLGHAEYRTVDFDAIIRLIVMNPSEMLDGRYVVFQINYRNPFHFEITSIPQLTVPQVARALIPLPSLPEQRRIAGALSDIDELISALGKLIEKKRNIKTGAMQELLGMRNEECGMRNVPRRRLAGFSGAWVEKRFDECFEIIGNNTYARECMCDDCGGVANIHYGDVLIRYGSVLDCSRTAVPSLINSIICRTDRLSDGDVIIADTAEDETVGKAIEIRGIEGRCAVSGLHTIACRPRFDFAPGWLGYYINSSTFHDQLLPLITGTKVSSISKAGLRTTILNVPTIAEQRAIATVLSDMDAEIEALEAKRAKYESIKQGMMQELLTGKTRLKGE